MHHAVLVFRDEVKVLRSLQLSILSKVNKMLWRWTQCNFIQNITSSINCFHVTTACVKHTLLDNKQSQFTATFSIKLTPFP